MQGAAISSGAIWPRTSNVPRGRRAHPLFTRDRGVVAAAQRARSPLYLRSDNGPEFVSRTLSKWIVDQGIGTALIDPGKPWQNGATESLIASAYRWSGSARGPRQRW